MSLMLEPGQEEMDVGPEADAAHRNTARCGGLRIGAPKLMLTLGDRPGSTRLHGSLCERPSAAAKSKTGVLFERPADPVGER